MTRRFLRWRFGFPTLFRRFIGFKVQIWLEDSRRTVSVILLFIYEGAHLEFRRKTSFSSLVTLLSFVVVLLYQQSPLVSAWLLPSPAPPNWCPPPSIFLIFRFPRQCMDRPSPVYAPLGRGSWSGCFFTSPLGSPPFVLFNCAFQLTILHFPSRFKRTLFFFFSLQ